MDAGTVRSWLAASAVAIREQRDYLTQLDAAIGDADHGANMDRGFTAVVERLDGEASSEPPGKLLLTAGSTLVSTVGGASGPLWGTALRRAGRVLGEAERSVPRSSSLRSTRLLPVSSTLAPRARARRPWSTRLLRP